MYAMQYQQCWAGGSLVVWCMMLHADLYVAIVAEAHTMQSVLQAKVMIQGGAG
jgi:hypothetical protein